MPTRNALKQTIKAISLASTQLPWAVRLGCVTALCLSSPVFATDSGLVTRNDGEFRFELKDYWLGQQAQVNYQATPWLNVAWQYNDFAGHSDTVSASPSEFERQAGYQYNAQLRLREETAAMPGVFLAAEDFLDTQARRSYGLYGQKHWGNWQVAAGYAKGKGLDGPQAEVRYRNLLSNTELSAVYHAQQDWSVATEPRDGLGDQVMLNAPQWHIGATWQPVSWAEVGVSFADTEQFAVSATLILDSKASDTGLNRSAVAYRELPDGLNVMDALAKLGLQVLASDAHDGLMTIVLRAPHTDDWPNLIAQARALLHKLLPPSIDEVEYIITQDGHALYATRQSVVSPESVVGNIPREAILGGRVSLRPLTWTQTELANSVPTQPLPEWSVSLDNVLYHPEPGHSLTSFWGLTLHSDWLLGQGWQLSASVQADLYDPFDNEWGMAQRTATAAQTISGLLPYRQLHQRRQVDDDVRLRQALLQKRGSAVRMQRNVHNSVHYHVFAGQVSSELHGFGGQLLYQPWQSRIALGAHFAQLAVSDAQRLARTHVGNLADVSENNFSGFRTQTSTGTLIAYWATPWHNMDVSLEMGQFIGRDKGGLVTIKRTFHNGWQFGLFSAHTRLHGTYYRHNGIELTIPLSGVQRRLAKVSSVFGQRALRYHSTITTWGDDAGLSLSEFTEDLWWQQRDARYDVFTQGRY